MSDNKPTGRDLAADAKAALDKLRAYAADHSDDILGAIDKLGDFVDKQTQGKYADKIDKAQAAAKKGVSSTLGTTAAPAHSAGETADPFCLDDEPTWKQPPTGAGAHAFTDAGEAGAAKPDLKAALAKLRAYAADHSDDLAGLVDKVGDFVDKQTQGKYAEKIDKAQAAAKTQIGKLR